MMKLIAFLVLFFLFAASSPVFAYQRGSHPSRDPDYSQDAYGHWTRNDNLWNDTDSDGTANYYDRNDRNPAKW